jgi:transglutaminase-like putative cysteine protease
MTEPAKTKKKKQTQLEESLALRLVALALAWWADLALAWTGAPAWVWMAGLTTVTLGHVFSWKLRNWSSPIRATLVALGLVAVLFLMRGAILQVPTGNLLPSAYLLVLLQGTASFELRSRGGLYASLALSALIFFFASQQALSGVFAIFVVGFAVLFLAFFAVAFFTDRVKQADVSWFKSHGTATAVWASVAVSILAGSVLIFVVLPKGVGPQVSDLQGSVVPIRGTDGSTTPQTAALPQTGQESLQAGASASEAQAGQESESQQQEQSSPDGGTPNRLALGPSSEGEGADGRLSPDTVAGQPVVMNVRSPGLSYWRGDVYDTFEGGDWSTDRSYRFSRYGIVVNRGRLDSDVPVYSQMFYLRRPIETGEVFTGYEPIAVSYRSTREGREDVAVYKVHSVLPDFTTAKLEATLPNATIAARYHRRLVNDRNIRDILESITGDTATDYQRARLIAAYLQTNFQFDQQAADQLTLTMPPDEFVRQQQPGTSMDFATAMVMLARGEGMPARLVTGYLPGRYDPLSGTFVVTEADRHAWAEVYLQGAGWVPFDGAPRTEVLALAQGTTYSSPVIGGLFETSYGEEAFQAIRSSPQQLAEAIQRGFATALGPVLAVVAILIFVTGIAVALWRLRGRRWVRRPRRGLAYGTLEGQGPEEMLRLYRRAEALLSRRGAPRRTPSQTVEEYAAAVQGQLAHTNEHFAWLARAAAKAAYDPSPFDQSLLDQAREQLNGLRQAIRKPAPAPTRA